jgi:uncharacterized metal-binding protein
MADCCGSEGVKFVYGCSGIADVGELADKVARKLMKDKFARGLCLAAIGGDISGFVQSAKGANENITIDGCPTACARKCLERIGVSPTSSYILTKDFGLTKGETGVDAALVSDICEKIQKATAGMITAGDTGASDGCGCGGSC